MPLITVVHNSQQHSHQAFKCSRRHVLQCRNLAAELGLTSIKAYKMDATMAVQASSKSEHAASESGDISNCLCASVASLLIWCLGKLVVVEQ